MGLIQEKNIYRKFQNKVCGASDEHTGMIGKINWREKPLVEAINEE